MVRELSLDPALKKRCAISGREEAIHFQQRTQEAAKLRGQGVLT